MAIVFGGLLGHFLPDTGVALKPLGDAFIALVKMIIAPVIFITVASGIVSIPAAQLTATVFVQVRGDTAPELNENFTAALEEIVRLKPSSAKGRYIQKGAISTTFGPGIPLDVNALV